jgi:hypothetical protein
MKKRKVFLRFLAVVTLIVVLLSGAMGIYRRILNPKFLKVNGEKVATQDVMDAYYQMNPEISKQIRVSRKNAVEAFLLRQKLYQAYLAKTTGRWVSGVIIDQQEAYTVAEEGARLIPVRRYFLDTGTDIFCVYTQNQAWRFPVKSRVKLKLGGEFKTLGEVYKVTYQGRTSSVRFSSVISEAQLLLDQETPPKKLVQKRGRR